MPAMPWRIAPHCTRAEQKAPPLIDYQSLSSVSTNDIYQQRSLWPPPLSYSGTDEARPFGCLGSSGSKETASGCAAPGEACSWNR